MPIGSRKEEPMLTIGVTAIQVHGCGGKSLSHSTTTLPLVTGPRVQRQSSTTGGWVVGSWMIPAAGVGCMEWRKPLLFCWWWMHVYMISLYIHIHLWQTWFAFYWYPDCTSIISSRWHDALPQHLFSHRHLYVSDALTSSKTWGSQCVKHFTIVSRQRAMRKRGDAGCRLSLSGDPSINLLVLIDCCPSGSVISSCQQPYSIKQTLSSHTRYQYLLLLSLSLFSEYLQWYIFTLFYTCVLPESLMFCPSFIFI